MSEEEPKKKLFDLLGVELSGEPTSPGEALHQAAVKALAGRGNPENIPDISTDEKLQLLREFQKSYSEWLKKGRCRFSPGDLVTSTKHSNHLAAGEPHIVLETQRIPKPGMRGSEHTNAGFGSRPDMRIARMCQGPVRLATGTWWVESVHYVEWSPTDG